MGYQDFAISLPLAAPQSLMHQHSSVSCAISPTIRLPFLAASAAFALNADEWFRRGLLPMIFAPRTSGLILAPRSSICTCRPVQESEAPL